MSFHPNDIARRARLGTILIVVLMFMLLSGFFNTQVLQHERYAVQSEENRLREVPLPAPRGIIYDRKNNVIAENLPAYTVSLLSATESALKAELARLGTVIQLTPGDIQGALKRFRREPNRPTVIFPDAAIDVVAVLEEHRIDFPSLIIQSVPKRYYPDGAAVSAFVGYTSEISESELNSERFVQYKMGQQIGKGGLERHYEEALHGAEGMRFVEVDARGRVVNEAGVARPDQVPDPGKPLMTNIDMDLQRYVSTVFGDTLIGGVIALDPKTGGVLAIHSGPGYDPNRFTGGIPQDYWKELNTDPKKPLYNKATQGTYPPGSTWKLVDAVIALENGIADFNTRMPQACGGGFAYGNAYFRCWDPRGHGSQNLSGAIEKSCNVYFYQLGLRMGLSRMLAGGIKLGMNAKSGLDLPNEKAPRFPYGLDYFNKKWGPRGWTPGSTVINLSIGQGENSQTLASMARFYSAMASDGFAAPPSIARVTPKRERVFTLTAEQIQGLRAAMGRVVSPTGTAGGSAVPGLFLGGKTGTAQSGKNTPDHAWFVGMAPVQDPKIVVAVMIEFGGHGWQAARVASRVAAKFLNIRHPADAAPSAAPAEGDANDGSTPVIPVPAPVALARPVATP
ncbi:MAG TPA: penicillin-binding protein 2 [Gemmatimonadaceae bacterium]|nr:penicillin-binding protein 2 [Gemmatimonadaceae bacterium]